MGLLARVKNPYLSEEAVWDDTLPRPGGVEGRPVDYERWYPPDTPFKWGQGFPTPFTNVPNANGGLFNMQFLPDYHWVFESGVPLESVLWPAAYGADGRFQAQLAGGTPKPTAGVPVSTTMFQFGQALSNLPAAPVEALAGSFGRS